MLVLRVAGRLRIENTRSDNKNVISISDVCPRCIAIIHATTSIALPAAGSMSSILTVPAEQMRAKTIDDNT